MAKVIILEDEKFESFKNLINLIQSVEGAVVMSTSMQQSLEENGYSQAKVNKAAKHYLPDTVEVEVVESAFESQFIDKLLKIYPAKG